MTLFALAYAAGLFTARIALHLSDIAVCAGACGPAIQAGQVAVASRARADLCHGGDARIGRRGVGVEHQLPLADCYPCGDDTVRADDALSCSGSRMMAPLALAGSWLSGWATRHMKPRGFPQLFSVRLTVERHLGHRHLQSQAGEHRCANPKIIPDH